MPVLISLSFIFVLDQLVLLKLHEVIPDFHLWSLRSGRDGGAAKQMESTDCLDLYTMTTWVGLEAEKTSSATEIIEMINSDQIKIIEAVWK